MGRNREARASVIGLLMALAWGVVDPQPRQRKVLGKPRKQCLECGATHSHNNSWCSAECCKAYRSKQKAHAH